MSMPQLGPSHMPQQLYDAVQSFMLQPCEACEKAVIDNLRCFHHVAPGAFIEYGCIEHGLVHVYSGGTWFELHPDLRRIHIFQSIEGPENGH